MTVRMAPHNTPPSSASGGMNQRHLVFDLDGTISNPAVGIARSINYALSAFGCEPVSEGRPIRSNLTSPSVPTPWPQSKPGDAVAFYGEYEWNEQGGLIHWTHRDPEGDHAAGWLKHNGRTYQ